MWVYHAMLLTPRFPDSTKASFDVLEGGGIQTDKGTTLSLVSRDCIDIKSTQTASYYCYRFDLLFY